MAEARAPVETPSRRKAARLPPLRPSSAAGMGATVSIGLGLGLLVLGVATVFRDDPLPMPLTVTLCLAGALEAALGWFTLRRMRGAWAFSTAIAGTAALAFLFSAPKIRDALEVGLGLALLPSLIGAAACILLALGADDIK